MELPEYFLPGYFITGADRMSPAKRHVDQKPGDTFAIDDLLDFSNADAVMSDGSFDNAVGNSSATTAIDSCNSSISGGGDNHFTDIDILAAVDPQISGELCVPYEDMAELEWLSNFVEESFPAEDDELKMLHLISGVKLQTPECSSSSDARKALFCHSETPPPGSKRSRAAPGDWPTRLLPLAKHKPVRKRDGPILEPWSRKCLHCAAEKTPQWRAGPMGPKTLCNACGVRYKSGRLVPEYRPAASPTFLSTKHSNSHRKVLELRRQKELQQRQHQHHLIGQSSIFSVSDGGNVYLIHHRNGPDFRHVI